jgi:long-chain acyl-CoA synthetase
MNVACLLERNKVHYASKPICSFRGNERSIAELSARASWLATEFRRKGAKSSCTIAVLATNSPDLLATLFAIWAIGAVAVPINPALVAPEVRAIVDHCEPSVVVIESQLLALLDGSDSGFEVFAIDEKCEWHPHASAAPAKLETAAVLPTDPALIYYTSGTTGTPKGAVISHAAMTATAELFSRQLMIGPEDRLLITGPMAFILHLTMNALTAVSGGASIVILERFHPDAVLKAIHNHRITVLIAVPTAYIMMLNFLDGRPIALPSLRVAISAGAAFPDALSKRIRSGLGIAAFDLWGMTECGPITTYDPSRDREGQPDSCGRPIPSCEIRIVDDDLHDLAVGEIGEVLAKSPGLMNGYYKNPQATSEVLANGWMRSGDLGRVSHDGFLYIVGRKKDLIIRGGANIYPVDIEEVLYANDAVKECAVIGVPDHTFGEVVKAFVVLRAGVHLAPSDLIAWCRRHIAEYKAPSEIEFVDFLPKGATGKILRRKLRELSPITSQKDETK